MHQCGGEPNKFHLKKLYQNTSFGEFLIRFIDQRDAISPYSVQTLWNAYIQKEVVNDFLDPLNAARSW